MTHSYSTGAIFFFEPFESGAKVGHSTKIEV